MIKKSLILSIINLFLILPTLALANTSDAEYLRNRKHIAILNPFAESVAQRIIKKALLKEIGEGDYKVKFEVYTISSLKKGIFKYLEIIGKNIEIEEIPIPYLDLKTITDYNWIDFKKKPVEFKSDINFAYNLHLTEKSINKALKDKDYEKNLEKINRRAYPLFTLHDIRIKIRHDKVYIIMDYSLPLSNSKKKRTFYVSTLFKVENGKISATDVSIDKSYGNLPLDKITNLINLIDPLSFTIAQINEHDCKGQIENVIIEDNIIKINGKMFIKSKGE